MADNKKIEESPLLEKEKKHDVTDNIQQSPILEKEKDEKTNSCVRKLKGIFITLLGIVASVVSAASVQLLERAIPDWELNAIRSAVALTVISGGLIWKKQWPLIPKSECIILGIYCFNGFAMSIGVYMAASLQPLATMQCIMTTANIVSGVILFQIILKDKMTLLLLCSVGLCLCGVVFAIQPDFIFDNQRRSIENCFKCNNATTRVPHRSITTGQDLGAVLNVVKFILAVLPGLTITVNTVIVKKRPYILNNMLRCLFWILLTNFIVSIFLMTILEKPVLPNNLDLSNLLLLSIHSLSFVMIWPTNVYALTHITGNTFNIVHSTLVIFMLCAQYTVLSSIYPGHKNWIELVGVFMVLGGSILGSVVELCKNED